MFADRRYQIFLSSTYDDLRNERQAATQSILAMGHLAAGMELFPASDLSQIDLIKRVISESDYYVVIMGGRYGSVHPETGVSFTEMEYDYALDIGLPILGFVVRDANSLIHSRVEADAEKRKALVRFREKVLSKTCQMFDEPSDLGLKVMNSLMVETRINPRTGWIRADQARSAEDLEEAREMRRLAKERDEHIEKLERLLRDAILPIPEEECNYACGDDELSISVRFQSSDKSQVLEQVTVTWDEIFSAIGTSMFGYIVRRVDGHGYPFEDNIAEFLRTKVFDRVGQRSIYLFPHEIDRILIQFKQLGYITMQENNEDGGAFRGFTLTRLGEHRLT